MNTTREENKRKKAEAAEIERVAMLLERAREDAMRYVNSEINREFEVGQDVFPIRANWYRCKIEEADKFYGVYLISYQIKEKGTYKDNKTWVSWRDITSKSVDNTENLCAEARAKMQNDVQFYNGSISTLLNKLYFFGVNMTPDYQRGLVWLLEDKEALIDSIFKGIEIGKFAFVRLDFKENSPCYEVLDGKQRMNALQQFYEDKFTYKGKKFSDLSPLDRHHFLEYTIAIGESRGEMSKAQKYEYFLRLNTRGREQEVEHIDYVRGLLLKETK